MLSGKDPGTLGCYGFRNRAGYSYAPMQTANATAIREPRVWDILSAHGKQSVILGVPQTYPPRPLNGRLVADFLAPDTAVDYTYPKSLKRELERELGEYILDVRDFRTQDKDTLLKRIHALMENRFAAARYLMREKPWDFFMLVEMGMDRLHHGFWRFCDPNHPRFEPDNPYRDAFKRYYEAVDAQVGSLLAMVGEETAVMIVSDHGARAMHGGFCVNEWLIREGMLRLNRDTTSITNIDDCDIDWPRTKAWASGGYYARVFINLEGREPQGCVQASDYDSFRDELARRIESVTTPDGRPLGNRAVKPQTIYRQVNGVPPDLLVYCGNLAWRAVGTVGYGSVFTFENDAGPDDANHDFDGIFVLDARSHASGIELQGAHIIDVAPTLLDLLGIPIPGDFQGASLLRIGPAGAPR